MNDEAIISLFENRDESAIDETTKKYGAYCTTIAMNVLHNAEDSQECVNDALLAAWNAIPPASPRIFSAFIGKIVRNIALNRYEARSAKKRGDSNALSLCELEGCLCTSEKGKSVENEVDAKILGEAIEAFLHTLKKVDRVSFVRRYWYNDSVSEIASRVGVKENAVAVNLHRTRNKLKTYLEKEGVL